MRINHLSMLVARELAEKHIAEREALAVKQAAEMKTAVRRALGLTEEHSIPVLCLEIRQAAERRDLAAEQWEALERAARALETLGTLDFPGPEEIKREALEWAAKWGPLGTGPEAINLRVAVPYAALV